jgi:CDP-diacylglycerol--glycerol-3-phosphate 3-phosphatidyltransferase
VANALTMGRLLLIPVFIYVLTHSAGGPSVAAAAIFAAASITDWLDGQVARRTGTVTEFGKFADPLADRLLAGSALIILLVQHRLPTIAVMIVLVRDCVVMAGYYVLARRKFHAPVLVIGKITTAVLMVAIFLVLLGNSWGQPVFWAGVVLSVASGVVYVFRGIRQVYRPRPGVATAAGPPRQGGTR